MKKIFTFKTFYQVFMFNLHFNHVNLTGLPILHVPSRILQKLHPAPNRPWARPNPVLGQQHVLRPEVRRVVREAADGSDGRFL